MISPSPLGEFLGIEWLFWWQPLMLLVVIALLIFLRIYKRKQM